MAIAFNAASSAVNSSTASNSLAITKPAALDDGDIILAFVYAKDTDGRPTISAPSGFTEIATQNVGSYEIVGLYWKLASSEGSSWSFTKNGTTANASMAGYVLAYSGCDQSDPIDAYSNTAYTTYNTAVRGGSVTTTVDNAMIVMLGFAWYTTSFTFTSASLTERLDDTAQTGASSYVGAADGDVAQASAGASGHKTCTLSISTSTKHGFLVALAPPAGGVPKHSDYYRRRRAA